jgi:glutamate-5-semialdehyde dehydrogenase
MIDSLDLGKIKIASKKLRLMASDPKNQFLKTLSESIAAKQNQLLEQNLIDVENFKTSKDFTNALQDRLTLNARRVQSMSEAVNHIISMPDPVGKTLGLRTLDNGLTLKQKTDSFGTILFIFEARPNVIAEAVALAIKSGNAIIMKCGKEAQHSAQFLFNIISDTLKKEKMPTDIFTGLSNVSREQTDWLMTQNKFIDLLIPRGGDKLIEHVKKHSSIPVIQNDRGLCHTYIDAEADLEMALKILKNAKTHRPGVCNATETVLVHKDIAKTFLPKAYELMPEVQWHCCQQSLALMPKQKSILLADKNSFDTEYLDLKINCKIVSEINEALQHIEQHGSKHSEAIVTNNEMLARRFQNEIDAAVVYWNASTRFTDGAQFGLGGEMGISTQKLHVRGPVGLEALTTTRWVVDGVGQIRS